MKCHYPDLGSASHWLKQISTNQEHYKDLGSYASLVWISAVVFQALFCGETSGDMAKT